MCAESVQSSTLCVLQLKIVRTNVKFGLKRSFVLDPFRRFIVKAISVLQQRLHNLGLMLRYLENASYSFLVFYLSRGRRGERETYCEGIFECSSKIRALTVFALSCRRLSLRGRVGELSGLFRSVRRGGRKRLHGGVSLSTARRIVRRMQAAWVAARQVMLVVIGGRAMRMRMESVRSELLK